MAGERSVKIRFDGDAKGVTKASEEGSQAVGKWSGAVDKASSAVSKSAAVAGAAIVAAFGAAVGAGLEQSQIKAKLAAQLGATGVDAQKAGDAAGDLYGRGVVSSMDEAAAAVKTIFQNNLVPKDAGKAEIDAVAARVSALAVTLDEDASAVGRAVSQMVRTGIAESSEEAFDILAKGTQLGINKSEDLLDTYNEYGTQFRKLGIEGPQSLGLLNQAIQAGARDSDVAADAIKEFSIRAIDGSKSTTEGFKALGLSAGDMAAAIAKGGPAANQALDQTLDKLRNVKDPVQQAAIATQLFGTQAEDLGQALFALDPSEATKSIGKLSGAAAQAGKTLEDNAGAKVQAFSRMVQDKLINALAGAVTWIQQNETLVKNLALVLGPIAGIIATIVAAIKIWTAVQVAFNAVMAVNPVVLIVAAIALVIAGIVLLATKTQFFQTIWKAVWGFIQSAAKAVADWFTGTIVPSFKRAWDQITAAAQAVANWFKNTLVPAFKAAFEALKTVVLIVVNVYKTAFNVLVTVVKFVYNVYVTYINLIIATIRKLIAGVQVVVDYVQKRWNAFIAFFQQLPGRIASASKGLWNGIKESFRAAINWIIDKWNGLSFSLPSLDTPFGKIGGTTISTPNLPRLASGGWAQPGRTYLTGEDGPELLTTGRRAYVSSAGDTEGMLNSTPEVHVYIGDRELTDIVDVRIETRDRATKRRVGARVGAYA